MFCDNFRRSFLPARSILNFPSFRPIELFGGILMVATELSRSKFPSPSFIPPEPLACLPFDSHLRSSPVPPQVLMVPEKSVQTVSFLGRAAPPGALAMRSVELLRSELSSLSFILSESSVPPRISHHRVNLPPALPNPPPKPPDLSHPPSPTPLLIHSAISLHLPPFTLLHRLPPPRAALSVLPVSSPVTYQKSKLLSLAYPPSSSVHVMCIVSCCSASSRRNLILGLGFSNLILGSPWWMDPLILATSALSISTPIPSLNTYLGVCFCEPSSVITERTSSLWERSLISSSSFEERILPPSCSLSSIELFSSSSFRGNLSNFFTDLFSYVAPCTESEEATGFVSTILGGDIWFSTSSLQMTKMADFGFAVYVPPTHPSLALDLLSSFYRNLYALISKCLCLFALIKRGCHIPSCCSLKV
uniref:Uncharacterized protein n=1 Tax=Noccaea caerulescens TaxID=107243 RepID=A0A1J3GNT3_NOCCA